MVNKNSNIFWQMIAPSPALLVTCIDEEGKPNIIAISWCMPVSENPPVVAISVRTHPRKRHSYKIIRETQEFAINVPSEKLAEPTNFCGTVSGRKIDKFKETKLTAVSAKKVKPPLIKECLGHIECKVIREIPIGDHSIFLGKVVAVSVDKEYFGKNGWALDKTHILLSTEFENVYTTSSGYLTVKPT